MNIPKSVLHRLPKTDLHLHLDGSLRLGTLIELAQKYGVELPADSIEDEVNVWNRHTDLGEYLKDFIPVVLQTGRGSTEWLMNYGIRLWKRSVY